MCCWAETHLVQDLFVEDSGPRGCRTGWSEPWRPWSHPSPPTLDCGSWRQQTGSSELSLHHHDDQHALTHTLLSSLTCTQPLWWQTRCRGALWVPQFVPLAAGELTSCSCDARSPWMLCEPGHSSLHTPSDTGNSQRISVRTSTWVFVTLRRVSVPPWLKRLRKYFLSICGVPPADSPTCQDHCMVPAADREGL